MNFLIKNWKSYDRFMNKIIWFSNSFQPPTRRKSSSGASSKTRRTTDSSTKSNGGNGVEPKNGKPIHACDKCPQTFFKLDRYNAHMRRHMGLKAYKCDECDKEFQNSYSLQTHKETFHFDESKGQPKYTCEVDGCGKTYTRKVFEWNSIDFLVLFKQPQTVS